MRVLSLGVGAVLGTAIYWVLRTYLDVPWLLAVPLSGLPLGLIDSWTRPDPYETSALELMHGRSESKADDQAPPGN